MEMTSSAERVERLFPSLPSYDPPRRFSRVRNRAGRAVSAGFLVVTIGLLAACAHTQEIKHRLAKPRRKHAEEERSRKDTRAEAEKQWLRRMEMETEMTSMDQDVEKRGEVSTIEGLLQGEQTHKPTEGGRDRMTRDVRYYARRCGLECETIDVQTEDGFILELCHIFDPTQGSGNTSSSKRRYPILMIHGLLQSSGAYACTDDHSFAFFFAKQGLDVWLGNNRCGFKPRHATFKPSDPRMWSWNIREMATKDLPALVDTVLRKTTGFAKLALVGHSQGTSQMLIALSKDFVPELGNKISIACMLAPAAYSGPLLEQPMWFFKAMEVMPPSLWRICFGKHAFIQSMIATVELLPNSAIGRLGYPLFRYMFKWSDRNWDQDLRTRSFLFAPTYVSSEHMRWWIGADGFPRQRCILNTRAEAEAEARDDEAIEEFLTTSAAGHLVKDAVRARYTEALSRAGKDAWFDERVPPLALWIPACDELVDGKRLLRRFEHGREPHAKVVHANVIDDYEHLDVIWAIDAIDRVGTEILQVIWETIDADVRNQCMMPKVLGGESPLSGSCLRKLEKSLNM